MVLHLLQHRDFLMKEASPAMLSLDPDKMMQRLQYLQVLIQITFGCAALSDWWVQNHPNQNHL